MRKRPRQDTITLLNLLQEVKEEDIRKDADTQRYGYAWKSKRAIADLIKTAITDDYIPAIILGNVHEENQIYLIDGLQRVTYLSDFRFANYRLPKKMEESCVVYMEKQRNGNDYFKDDNGNIVMEEKEYDIADKTYDELPKELQKKFNMCQIQTVTFECETMEDLCKLIFKYNNHTPMNSRQKAFSKLINIGCYIRPIIESRFFADTIEFKKQFNGTANKLIVDALMLANHKDSWKSSYVKRGEYLDSVATKKEIELFGKHLDQLYENVNVADERIRPFFVREKNCYIFMAAYEKFLKLEKDDSEFEKFMIYFSENLSDTWKELDADRHTENISIVNGKWNEMMEGMNKFFSK